MRLLVREANRFLDNEGTPEREEAIFGNNTTVEGPALDGSETMSFSDITDRLTTLEKEVLQKNEVVEKLYVQLAHKREYRYVVERELGLGESHCAPGAA